MQLVSIIRTAHHSALTVSGVRLPGDVDIRVSPGSTYAPRTALSLASDAGSLAIAVARDGRAGILFDQRVIQRRERQGQWCRRVLDEALAQDDLEDAGAILADRMVADDQDSVSGLLSEYEQCHAVRFTGRGTPSITTVRANHALLSFWNEFPGLTLAEDAYVKFEAWVESGLNDPLGLHAFHFAGAVAVEDRPERLAPYNDIAQIHQSADRSSARVRLWSKPKDIQSRPFLSLNVPLVGTAYRHVSLLPASANPELAGLGNISQNNLSTDPTLRDTRLRWPRGHEEEANEHSDKSQR